MVAVASLVFALALLLTGLLFGPILLIRAWSPYADDDVRAFLLPPEDCAPPCFLGVRPGVTRSVRAREILLAQPWVVEVRRGGAFFFIQADPAHPGLADSEYDNYYWGKAEVEDVRVRTTIPLWQALLLLGVPPRGETFAVGRPPALGQNLYYEQLGLVLHTLAPCPLNWRAVWAVPVEAQWGVDFKVFGPYAVGAARRAAAAACD